MSALGKEPICPIRSRYNQQHYQDRRKGNSNRRLKSSCTFEQMIMDIIIWDECPVGQYSGSVHAYRAINHHCTTNVNTYLPQRTYCQPKASPLVLWLYCLIGAGDGSTRKGHHWQRTNRLPLSHTASSRSSSKFSKERAKAGQQPGTDHMSVQPYDCTRVMCLCVPNPVHTVSKEIDFFPLKSKSLEMKGEAWVSVSR